MYTRRRFGGVGVLSLAKARKDYYLQKVGEITPREDYYLRGGTASGSWHGGGAAEMGIDGAVTAEGLVRLFDGQHPETGEQLGHRLRKDGVAAWDLTFSADKSVSLLWAFGDDEARKHVVEAFEEATAEAVLYMESVASSTRGASRTPVLDDDGVPVLDDDGMPRHRVETWPIRTEGYVSAWFTEFTSRADDPQLHTHVVVGNRVKGVDGVWRAIDGRLLYRNKLAAGYLHEAELRSRLTERLGVRWQPVHSGMADIDGFTREQVMAFSQRRQEIVARRSRYCGHSCRERGRHPGHPEPEAGPPVRHVDAAVAGTGSRSWDHTGDGGGRVRSELGGHHSRPRTSL